MIGGTSRRVLARAAVAVAACAAIGEPRAAPPARVEIRYDVSYNGTVFAEATDILEHDGSSYRIQSRAQGRGLLALLRRGELARSSRGTISPEGLRPQEFRDQRGERTPESVSFDWPRQSVVLERDGRRQSLPAANDMQDRLSFTWGFAFLPSVKGEISATIVDGRGTTRYSYRLEGSEELKTPAGTYQTLHLVKQRDGPDDRATELWLGGRDRLPVRILVIEKDGTRVDQVATRIVN